MQNLIRSLVGFVVGGPVADEAPASGDPVPVGGKYNVTLPAYTDGDRTQHQATSDGSLRALKVASTATPSDGLSNASLEGVAIAIGSQTSGRRTGVLQYIFNGTTWDRQRSGANNADAVATTTLGAVFAAAFGFLFNGSTWDRSRTNSAANISATTQPFAQAVARPGQWTVSAETAGAAPSINKAAGAAGVRHVLQVVSFQSYDSAALTVAGYLIRDGATGVGPVIWRGRSAYAPALSYGSNVNSGLEIFGSPATAMTLDAVNVPATGTTLMCMAGYSTI